jgi:GxxExxY protein
VETEVYLPLIYDGVQVGQAYRIDMIVEELIIVELKSVEAITPVHKAQLASYLKLSGRQLGLVINFNVVHLKEGIKRVVLGQDWREVPNEPSVRTP